MPEDANRLTDAQFADSQCRPPPTTIATARRSARCHKICPISEGGPSGMDPPKHDRTETTMKKRLLAAPLAIAAIACTVLLGACGGPSIEELIRTDLTEAFDSISPDNEEFVDSLTDSTGGSLEILDLSAEDFAKGYFDGFEYEIGDISVEEKAGTASARVKVKMKSITDAMADFTADYEAWIMSIDPSAVPSEEELYAKGGELMMASIAETPAEESDITFTYSKNENGEWEPSEGADEAILGAML